MTSNAPPFDPLNCSDAEERQMMRGYMAAGLARGEAGCPETATIAFAHGWRMRRNDMAGVADDDQRKLARRLAEQREARRG